MTNNEGPLKLNIKDWHYSDDTVMHMATALALIACSKSASTDDIARQIAIEYKKCWSRMGGRAPGDTTETSVMKLK